MRVCSAKTPAPLLGAGIDAERVLRFAKVAQGDLPFVYSPRESAHLAALPDPPRAFAAAFCCKEALFKALGRPYDWRDCELTPGGRSPLSRRGPPPAELIEPLRLAPGLRAATGVGSALARLIFDAPDECVALVYTFEEEA